MTTSIHPSAQISPSATIADGVEIGANVIVGDHSSIGAGTKVMANAVIGPWTKIGENNTIHYGAIVGHDPQDFGYKGEESWTIIGNGNIIREGATIHRGNRPGTNTVVGDNNFFMVNSHVGHNCVLGNNIILVNGVLLAGHVVVEDRAIVSGNCVVHQFCRIGKFAMMRGLSRTSRDVPPFCIMDDTHTVKALNLVGLRRNGFDQARIRAIKNAFKLLFLSGLNMQNALAEAERTLTITDDVRYLLDFIKSAKRGVCFGHGVIVDVEEKD
ncbi:acyl-(acyl-carrier-protein)--UDP-N-acetylglucosamine O-acyltransferase [Geobacter metallireducens RCH3]|uniref:Acyl-(Acyl carrier protein)--UDP-N-acetylglucosamine/UDP-2-N-acetylglucose-2, 3-diamine 3-O/N-acyltransferase n=1 Tax=Geobacter metallireducens (strain ATCC 53774 / DSM 7210 / GS-15) TaxID=269799 RepID=Q39SI8_GEOMG|nr:acyl-ACP--UDP-N-acetylglucosamine O-acyltransferase [Geobacter metallireducens]ABB32786.1 acyl-(acyl carrier protein)--UDP-N-acetylglucosamine/UDP-2-N-acetylglucose-2,3-diamine 3-O/N-acyltransferase [Geobacter metallireducens GS-15]EHP86104.1 acyl-(acyl-carrier-protein)--UDP-N-acetylglucosamine O-acyltransferase [Geobacter metallireducens RCH3]